MMKITDIKAIEILDSRGKPTVRTFVTLSDGSIHQASVPSGASTGAHEAVELRDNDPRRHAGQGVLKAVEHVNTEIKTAIVGMDISDLKAIDAKMIEIDGTENKGNLGANAILSVSMAAVRAAASVEKKPLWKFINEYYFADRKPAFP
ncbi:phosphopyruvate hydratase, partial [Candidatus Woesebacteria bacterium]|nr:phosphopyruvate hydratase [Candidatus Woesebacteria bacterium]